MADKPLPHFVIHADTPDELRVELSQFFDQKAKMATARSQVRNQSPNVTRAWAMRAQISEEVSFFLQKLLRIEPKATDPLNQPEN